MNNFLQFFQSNTPVCLIIHAFCKSFEPEIVLEIKSKQKTTQASKQKLLQVRKSYKTRESTLSGIGNSEENIIIDLSHIYLAV